MVSGCGAHCAMLRCIRSCTLRAPLHDAHPALHGPSPRARLSACCALAQVGAINAGAVPEISSVWTSVVAAQRCRALQTARAECVRLPLQRAAATAHVAAAGGVHHDANAAPRRRSRQATRRNTGDTPVRKWPGRGCARYSQRVFHSGAVQCSAVQATPLWLCDCAAGPTAGMSGGWAERAPRRRRRSSCGIA